MAARNNTLVLVSVRQSAPRREDASEHHFSRLSQPLLNDAKSCSLQLGKNEKEKEKEGDWRVDMKSYDRKIQSQKIKFLMTEKRKEVFFC